MARKLYFQTTDRAGNDCNHRHATASAAAVCAERRQRAGQVGVRVVKVHEWANVRRGIPA